jgi:hypothetical protein
LIILSFVFVYPYYHVIPADGATFSPPGETIKNFSATFAAMHYPTPSHPEAPNEARSSDWITRPGR